MQIEHIILAAMWVFGFLGFILFIPRKNMRHGLLAYLMFQAIIWLCDMPAFEFGLLSAPVREFPKATDLAITINYFFYPVLFSIYYVRKRGNGSMWPRVSYFLIWVSAVTLYDMIIESFTDLLEYGSLRWYGMWMYIAFLFFISEVCCNWFYKDKAVFQAERRETS